VDRTSQLLGFAGALIVALGYVPQITHLARARCSAGVSVRAWVLWLTSTLLVFAHALAVTDVVFIFLQVVNVVAMVTIILLARKYANSTCALHRPAAS
jgi:lipid-A-disaccharide synthase-like uncharacterized protein